MERLVDSILEKRYTDDDITKVELQINERQFFDLYNDIDIESAADAVRIYLDSKADDGRPENIDYKYDKQTHIIRITADLNYLENDYTEFINRHRDSTFD